MEMGKRRNKLVVLAGEIRDGKVVVHGREPWASKLAELMNDKLVRAEELVDAEELVQDEGGDHVP